MSQYSRNERNANAGIVVGITPEKIIPASPLAGIALQRHWEEQAFVGGRRNLCRAGAARGRFSQRAASTALGSVIPSYRPGVTPTDLSTCLPDYAIAAIREALTAFGRQIKGFDMEDAVLTGVETRTSSPGAGRARRRFPKPEYPRALSGGEGAGYAGGILSAAWTASRWPKPWRWIIAGSRR